MEHRRRAEAALQAQREAMFLKGGSLRGAGISETGSHGILIFATFVNLHRANQLLYAAYRIICS